VSAPAEPLAGPVDVVAVDPDDSALVDAWHAAYLRADTHGRERTAAPWQHDEVVVDLRQPSPRQATTCYAGLVDGRVVSAGYVELPLLDNPHLAFVQVWTVPEERDQGYAAAVLARLEEHARAAGRRVLMAEVVWPWTVGPVPGETRPGGVPGVGFARRHGYGLALGDVQRRLELPVTDAVLDELATEAAREHAGYELRSWAGPLPDDVVGGWAELAATIDTEAPSGDLDLAPMSADVAAVRDDERRLERQGRTRWHTVALDRHGRVAAYSELVTTVHEPRRAYQWGTLVARGDRGHRLGMAVKVANLRQLQTGAPGVDHVITWNAASNEHMVAVNDRLGFVPTERMGEFQKRLR
jgi:GNAT superfamily N-acetyltransferase